MKKIIQIASMALVLSGSAYAEDPTNLSDLSLESLMDLKVTTVSRREESVSQAPATTYVITEQQIKDRDYRSLGDILSDLPGIDITRNAGRFGDYPTIRGITGNDLFMVMVDGHKINPPTSSYLNLGKSVSVLLAKQVEVVYGPNSALYGADAFSVVINIITKSASAESGTATLGAAYGSLDTTDFTLQAFPKAEFLGDFKFYAFGDIYNSSGPNFVGMKSTYDIVTRYPDPLTPAMQQPVHDYNVFLKGENDRLSISYYRKQFNEGASLLGSPKGNILSDRSKWLTTTDMLWTNYDFIKTDKEKLNLGITLTSFVLDPSSQILKPTTSNVPTSPLISGWNMETSQSVRASLLYTGAMRDGADSLTLGADGEFIQSSPPPTTFDLPFGTNNPGNSEVIAQRRADVFAEYSLKALDNLTFNLGARVDTFDRFGTVLNPRANAVFQASDSTTLKVLYGSGFQAVPLQVEREAFVTPFFVQMSVAETGIKLNPQRIKTLEFVVNQKIGSKMRLNADAYYNNLTDVFKHAKLVDAVAGVSAARFGTINAFSQNTYGFDLQLSAVLSKDFVGDFAYSFVDGFIDTVGQSIPVPNIANNKLWGSLTYTLGNVSFHPKVKWLSQINTAGGFFNASYSAGSIPGFFLADLTVRAKQVLGIFDAVLDVSNILGTYYETATYPWGSGENYPGLGRFALIGLEAKF
ncbi:MAG: TonB-dependent receptor [Bdellovibrionia bacterium]